MTKKETTLLTTAVLSLLLLCTIPRTQANPGPMTIRVEPNTIEVTPSILFTVFQLNITMVDAHDVAGIQFALTYNTTILTCTNIALPTGHFMDPSGTEEAEGNLWRVKLTKNDTSTGYPVYGYTYYDLVAATGRGTVPRTGNGVLATLTMNATAVGVTEVAFSVDDTVIGDSNGVALTTVMDDGTVTVVPELNLTMLALLLPIMTLVAFATRRLLPKRK